jgi:succinoglycan biosynthesis transport protein ExoP
MPGMNTLEVPTPPAPRIDEKMQKIILGIAGSGLALGVGLALLIELMLNRGLRRPIELETQLQIPLLLSIPEMPRLRGNAGLLEYKGAQQRNDLYLTMEGEDIVEQSSQPEHFILPYTDAVRDRLIFHFELHDMRHKPKLVALTGLSEGAGTSTLAAGLAMAFARSDRAKVLLVDMNSGENGVNSAFPGLHQYTLPKALEIGRGDSERHQDEVVDEEENLFLAKVTPGRNSDGEGSFAPRNLYDLMPDLRSSHYDYIIFDMPPVGLTSPTVSMAGLMDKVLLVLDSEKTDRDVLTRRYNELAQGKAHVSCVYNKVKRHAPKWVQGEI